jgi:hypothetical protein
MTNLRASHDAMNLCGNKLYIPTNKYLGQQLCGKIYLQKISLRKNLFAEKFICGKIYLRKNLFAEKFICGKIYLRKNLFADKNFEDNPIKAHVSKYL